MLDTLVVVWAACLVSDFPESILSGVLLADFPFGTLDLGSPEGVRKLSLWPQPVSLTSNVR